MKRKRILYGELIFEGEYLNGKREGKGKKNNEFSKTIFEGDYRSGKKWNGKGFDSEGNIIYELTMEKEI